MLKGLVELTRSSSEVTSLIDNLALIGNRNTKFNSLGLCFEPPRPLSDALYVVN